MFGMGFMEIFLVLIVAIIALGPEKLPGAIVDTVKFFKKIKSEISDAKSSIDKELDLSGMKQDAEQLKESISNIQDAANIDIDEITQVASEPQKTLENEIYKAKEATSNSSKKERISMDKGEKA